jgi:hypothetical protein
MEKRVAMKLTWYPRNLAVAVVFLAAFPAVLNLALDFRRGAIVGGIALAASVGLDALLTLNPARWWRDRRSER